MTEKKSVTLAELLKASIYSGINETNNCSQELLLDNKQTEVLVKKMLLLPDEYLVILFSKYVFSLSPSDITKLFQIDHSKEKALYCERLLCYSLKLMDHQFIVKSTWTQACSLALLRYTQYGADNDVIHNYSQKFKKALINHITFSTITKSSFNLKKKICILIAAAILSIGTLLVANAEIRTNLMSWFVKHFPDYSLIGATGEVNIDFELLKQLKIEYIPEGYEFLQKFDSNPMISYYYTDAKNNMLTVTLYLSNTSNGAYNTEGVQIEPFSYSGYDGFCWQKDGVNYVIAEADGYTVNLVGSVEIYEFKKILKNIC